MSNNIVIRPTQASDAQHLKSALLSIWHDTYDSFLGAERVTKLAAGWHTIDKLEAEAEAQHICSLVALDGAEIVGHALMYAPEPHIIHLARLYLAHDLHGQGIGKSLLHKSINAFPHARKAYLEVYEPNIRAANFYKMQGFEIVERMRDTHTVDVLFEYRMEKFLTV